MHALLDLLVQAVEVHHSLHVGVPDVFGGVIHFSLGEVDDSVGLYSEVLQELLGFHQKRLQLEVLLPLDAYFLADVFLRYLGVGHRDLLQRVSQHDLLHGQEEVPDVVVLEVLLLLLNEALELLLQSVGHHADQHFVVVQLGFLLKDGGTRNFVHQKLQNDVVFFDKKTIALQAVLLGVRIESRHFPQGLVHVLVRVLVVAHLSVIQSLVEEVLGVVDELDLLRKLAVLQEKTELLEVVFDEEISHDEDVEVAVEEFLLGSAEVFEEKKELGLFLIEVLLPLDAVEVLVEEIIAQVVEVGSPLEDPGPFENDLLEDSLGLLEVALLVEVESVENVGGDVVFVGGIGDDGGLSVDFASDAVVK